VISERYSNIDQLRFIAALSVALTHLIIFNKGYSLNLEIISSISVEVFFIISGFVLAPQILNILENNKLYNYKIFLIRRWYRTIPLYVLSLLLTSLVLNEILTFDFLKYLLFFQNFHKIFVENDYFSISWSLSVEEWFYIIFPLFLLIVSSFIKIKKKNILFASIFFILIIFFIRFFFAESDDWGSGVRRVVLYRLDAIVFGFILFFFKDKVKPILFYKISLLLIFFLLSITIFKILEINALKNLNFYKISFHFIVAMWGSSMVLLFYLLDKNIKNKKIVFLNIFLGKISYSIYLFHLLIIYIISPLSVSLILTIVIFFILQILISTLLYYYFEEPILRARPEYK